MGTGPSLVPARRAAVGIEARIREREPRGDASASAQFCRREPGGQRPKTGGETPFYPSGFAFQRRSWRKPQDGPRPKSLCVRVRFPTDPVGTLVRYLSPLPSGGCDGTRHEERIGAGRTARRRRALGLRDPRLDLPAPEHDDPEAGWAGPHPALRGTGRLRAVLRAVRLPPLPPLRARRRSGSARGARRSAISCAGRPGSCPLTTSR